MKRNNFLTWLLNLSKLSLFFLIKNITTFLFRNSAKKSKLKILNIKMIITIHTTQSFAPIVLIPSSNVDFYDTNFYFFVHKPGFVERECTQTWVCECTVADIQEAVLHTKKKRVKAHTPRPRHRIHLLFESSEIIFFQPHKFPFSLLVTTDYETQIM